MSSAYRCQADYLGHRVALVDFDLHKEKGTHLVILNSRHRLIKKSPVGVKAVTDWVVQYFSPSMCGKIKTIDDALRGASPVMCTNKMPLILQHNGHSRTIVGYEVSQNGVVNLLCFDPAKWVGLLSSAGRCTDSFFFAFVFFDIL